MSEQQQYWSDQGRDDHFGQGNQQANAFGQPQHDKYFAHDERPYQTGNVSWESQPNHKGKGPKGYRRPDKRIQEDVCQILTEDDTVDATEIDVQVVNGEVTISGVVNDRNERRRAEDVIDAVAGVEHIQNNLRVRKEKSPESM